MTNLSLRPIVEDEVDRIAHWNALMNEDQKAPGHPSVERLVARHRAWLAGSDWIQEFVCRDGEPIGYLVHAPPREDLTLGQEQVQLRQFYIDRPHRRGGIGRAAVEVFLKERVGPGRSVHLDVFDTNARGMAFWTALGFQPYFRVLRRVT